MIRMEIQILPWVIVSFCQRVYLSLAFSIQKLKKDVKYLYSHINNVRIRFIIEL